MLFTPLKPMLLGMLPEPFDDNRYIFEPKADGYRVLLHKQGSRIEAYTRNGNVITKQFPEFQALTNLITADEAILDGEGACFADNRFWFERFDSRARLRDPLKIERAQKEHPATFFAFDVLYRDGESVISLNLMKRKAILEDILIPGPALSVVPFVEGNGIELWEQTKELGWEGCVAKRTWNSAYRLNTRSDAWQKIKHWKFANVTVMGYQRGPFRLIVGETNGNGELVAVAAVEHGFRSEEKAAFLGVVNDIRTGENHGVEWVEPYLRAEVKYLERTPSGKLRIPSFVRFAV